MDMDVTCEKAKIGDKIKVILPGVGAIDENGGICES